MPSLERFAAFVEKYGTVSKTRATRATRATPAQGAQETAISTAPSIVARAGDSQAIRTAPEPSDSQKSISVAHVAQVSPKSVTKRAILKIKENCEFQDSVAHVAQVAQENDKGLRRKGTCGWDAEEWRAFFHERAAIAEENGLARAEAEARAYESCIVVWLNRNPPSENGPGCCVQCSKPMDETEALPFLTGEGGHVWMHDCSHAPWMRHRRAEAVDVLGRMGIVLPSG